MLQYEIVFPNFNIHAICNSQENVWLQFFFLLNLSLTDFGTIYINFLIIILHAHDKHAVFILIISHQVCHFIICVLCTSTHFFPLFLVYCSSVYIHISVVVNKNLIYFEKDEFLFLCSSKVTGRKLPFMEEQNANEMLFK